MNLKILNKKEVKNILNLLNKQFDFKDKLDYVFLQNEKGKLFIANKEIFDVDFKKIKINNLGLYFGQLKNNELRLSIEGSQLIGKDCSKNILELNNKQKQEWMKGIDINYNGKSGFVLIKYANDFLGCGKIIKDKILNFVPKERRLRVVND